MRIDNDTQADAVTRWMERVNRHIIDLKSMSRRSSADMTDHIEISERLHGELEVSLINYREEKDGNEIEEVSIPAEEDYFTTTDTDATGRVGEQEPDEETEGFDPGSEGAVLTEETETSIAQEGSDVLPGEDPVSER